MKILVVHRAIQREGGAENQIARLTEQYVARGHHVTIVAAELNPALWYKDHYARLGVPVIETGLPRPSVPIFKGFWSMRRALRRFPFHEYDVVNFHNYPSYWHATLVDKARPDAPVVTWTCNEAAPEIWYYSDYAVTRSVRTTLRRALWRGFWLTAVRPFERQAMRAMDRIYVLSPAEAEFLKHDYGFDAVPMGSGVDVAEFRGTDADIRARYGIQADQFNLLCAPLDLPVAADMLRELLPRSGGGVADWRLHVLGRTSPAMMRRAQAMLGDRVQFLGHVPLEDLPGIYAAVDLGLFTRQYYPWGLVVIEMMACETPVLAFNTGARRYMIQDGVTGFLADTRAEYGARLLDLVQDPTPLQAIGRQARTWVQAHYTWDRVAEHYLADFAALVARKRGGAT
ncbi:MAG: glycosyltransferase family 4 protein [Chloroflexi bacterium]|nr:glycosyltransferase family 4 protein [Chloroflexota bacterium]MBU1750617.1 glycosyltransferase family 4 protein [Chloroflexota bacterium]MBU1879320.1 glycosyltransferase family 4 protein [Chloroflexota bacterium]